MITVMTEQMILNEIKILEDIILMRDLHDMGMIPDDTYKAYLQSMAMIKLEEINNVDKAQ